MPFLRDVYGVSPTVPQYTYVDRSDLDARIAYILKANRHLIIHGGSKQGKSVLRRKHIKESDSFVVQCQPEDTVLTIFKRIVDACEPYTVTTRKSARSAKGSGGLGANAELAIPLFAKGTANISAGAETGIATEETREFVADRMSLEYLARCVKAARLRIVLEDFHYLAEEEREKLAFALKALWDLQVFVVIIGIWAEQNLLLRYNNDLSGRLEEIDVRWSNDELELVISQGEKPLNITFGQSLRREMVSDANGNVGLLQRLLEGVCLVGRVYQTQDNHKAITDGTLLEKCRITLCQASDRRYVGFANIRGYRNPENTKLDLYRRIARVVIEATDRELLDGISRDDVLKRIQQWAPEADLQNLQKALIRLDQLQIKRKISPLIASYSDGSSQKLALVDRELLFYRKYKTMPWPWDGGDPLYERDDFDYDEDADE